MDGLWMGGLGGMQSGQMAAGAATRSRSAESAALEAKEDIRELRHQVERLTLLNQAMWELIRGKAGLTDADLERMAHEIDLRDGQADGKMGGSAVTCPTCRRVSNANHYKCLYCGELFEKPIFG
ncbi:MAG: hypothetical protein KDB61_12235 [Planctomycetes bacterium]|nr:hypothetical protein [Planctomycetota bacterium]